MGYTNNTHLAIDRDTRLDQKISTYIVFYFFASVANATIKTVLPIPDALWAPLSAAWGAAIVFFMLRCIGGVWRRQSRLFAYSLGVFSFVYALSFVNIISRGEPTDVFLKGALFLTFAWWIPIGISAVAVQDKQVLYQTFLRWSYPMALMLYSCLFFRQTDAMADPLSDPEDVYNMFFGFHMVLPTLLHINEYLRTHKRIVLVWFIVDVLLVLIYGNRGALIPIFFFLLYKYVVEKRNGTGKRMNRMLVILLSGTIFILFSTVILNSVNTIGESIGVKSRTLSMLAEGQISNNTGRDELFEMAFDMIGERPIFGYGLGGEFYQIGYRLYGGNLRNVTNAFTPHNGVLQNMCNFGIIGGLFVTLLFLVPLFRLNRIKDDSTYSLALIFGAWTIPMYISASGFLIEVWASVFFYLYYFSPKTIR